MEQSKANDPNSEETEDQGYELEALRRLLVRQKSNALRGQTQHSMPLQKDAEDITK